MTTSEIIDDPTLDPTALEGAADPDALAPVPPVVAALFRDARTVGRFRDAPVPDDLVRDVHDAVRWGPTANNSTPLRLLVVRSPEARERLAAHVAEFNRERVLAAPLTLVVAADTDFHHHFPTLVPHAPTSGERLAGVPDVRERMARENAWLQTGYLVVGLRAAGLGVGPMTGIDAAAIDADLLAGTSWRTLSVLNVGWPDGTGTERPRAPRLGWDVVAREV
ncbi:malonic semialdehyde reductase [Cellulomonas sp. zg-ZUI222]|uniref:Malonic semialdehyde reductase n=1 Tax=Cellulomonas wangleii TaxID=2816956 RepID=A0ABX8D1T0_9CELL|nr:MULTISPECIES: malonic semialdehyde reductase [Cellulomonas]MBO0899697.1 malonic semialdehyde reductase [Cellulomonas sp. zg-ZUI22]MBO0920559.1 malonic semialdehyde reductase [Cellulomonas wangleii]MBO0923023.1 malonic semialdehyde reductase [Cellulomonas wangleii]QVI61410.1 malonic semialdehyde reductase [Cellulomonas wangleii]